MYTTFKSTRSHGVFDADRAITSRDEDKLNRALFAEYLARCMLDHKDSESLVIGLYGGWGVGKTSIINLALEELHFASNNMEDSEKPIILNFSTWSYSGQNQLIYSFFRRLSSTLREIDYLENKDEIIHLLELYVSYFTQKPVPKALRTKQSLWKKITWQEKEEIHAWESGRDLTSVKAELNTLLKQQKHKIIITIDNISRMEPREIKQIFQIVKSMGDYANTIYLLAFDKDHVMKVIDELDHGGGKNYVEKIVQLPFAVPPILKQDLDRIFADRLSDALKSVPDGSWNVELWADIYYSSLKYFFENGRDITRYVNTLNFSYPRLKDIVNPVDFFALTALEVFTPDVYTGIRDNKDLFTDLFDHVYAMTALQNQKDIARCDEILNRTKRLPKAIILELLIRLFPRIRKLYQPDVSFYHSETIARNQKRLSCPDLFDVYFRLSMQSTQIQHSEFETILAIASNDEEFDQALARLNQDNRILKFIDQLDGSILQKIPRDQIQTIINALIDNADLFPVGATDPLNLNTPMRIHRIIHKLLQRFSKADDRFIILQKAINKAIKSLYIIVHELNEQAHEHTNNPDTFLPIEFRDLTTDQLNDLKKIAVERIKFWAENGSLATHPQILSILLAWLNWGNANECQQYVHKLTKTDKGLVDFLVAALNSAIDEAMTHYQKKDYWNDLIQNIETFISITELQIHAKTLFEDGHFEKLREREQLALMIFLDLAHVDTDKTIPNTS